MKITIPKVYPITDTHISGLSHLEQVRRLVSGGASLIQLRDKSAGAGAFYDAAVEAISYAHEHGVKIIINDRADIALAARADGVHLGQDDLSPTHARSLLGADAIIGFSTHSVEQARAALDLPIDYLAIGPIFATSTKADPDPVVGIEGLTAVRKLVSHLPLVAIGGIDRQNAAAVLETGADALAVISDLLADPADLTERTRQFFRVTKTAINIVGNS